MNCSSLESIEGLSRTLAALNISAFDHCTALRTIRLPAGVKKLSGNLFKDCTALLGRIDLPFIESIIGTAGSVPFIGCTGGITEFHFASANAASVMSSSGYLADNTLGTGTAVCKFDL